MSNSEFDISICITTYNRAAQLSRCLDHLLTFKKIRFEVIIGDDASPDNTEEVVKTYVSKFPHFTYHRHKHNLGLSKNTDAITRMARGEYIYILSDDDLVFENALAIMKQVLDSRPSAVCIGGPSESVEKTVVGVQKDYTNTKVRVFDHRDYADLAENIIMASDGYQFMRKDVYQRFCAFYDRSFCLADLIFKMLSIGEVLYLEKPVFQHCRSSGSMSTSLAEPWFIDSYISDFEIALSDVLDQIPEDKLGDIRNRALRNLYFQGARRAMICKDFGLFWYFMQRTKAVDGLKQNCLLQSEINYLPLVAVDRLSTILDQSGSDTVVYQDTPLINAFIQIAKQSIKEKVWKVFNGDEHEYPVVNLLENYDDAFVKQHNLNNMVSLLDVMGALQQSRYTLNIDVVNGQLKLSYVEEEANKLLHDDAYQYQLLHAKYEA